MSDPIARLNAALEGRYTIERELGEGGMATVYLADDLKHERKVALKVLKPELAAVVGAERFLSEIKVTANLNHPHILPLHDSGEADGFLFYVMPYLEGESLRDRIDREKQLPVDEAVRIASAVANALDHAHRHKVIHRDIKPANILLQDGEPVVADFGIALAVGAAGSNRLTETGLSLGTPYYMSPEQATGDQPVGASTDTYALGSVLYEMLVGEPPYPGTTAQAVLGKIIAGKPVSATEQRPSVPANVDAALRCALEKLPADRFKDAAQFADALADQGFRHGETDVGGAARPGVWKPVAVAGWGTALLFVALLGWALTRSPPTTGGVPTRASLAPFELRAPEGSGERIEISPDGSQIVASSVENGVSRLFLRLANQLGFSEIPGAQGDHPAFSPDGTSLLFTSAGGIRRIDPATGLVVHLAEGEHPHWALDGQIVYVGSDGGLYLISPEGGDARLVLQTDLVGRPHLLPNGKAVVFQAGGEFETRRLKLVEIGSDTAIDLGLLGHNPRYVPTGHLVYSDSEQRLMAAAFDVEKLDVTGDPFMVLPEVLVYRGGATQFAVSENGTAVVGLPGSADVARRLTVVDLVGTETVLPIEGNIDAPRFSPDHGRLITYERDLAIRVFDRVTGADRALTGGRNSHSPSWSPDGRYVRFTVNTGEGGGGGWSVMRRVADGSAPEESVLSGLASSARLLGTSPDRAISLLERPSPGRGIDLLTVAHGDSAAYSDYLRADWNEFDGSLSPDGTRVAYVSDESGRAEVYVRSFPEPGEPVRVSLDGGTEPVWAPDGGAIYFRGPERSGLMGALVDTRSGFSVARPERILDDQWARASSGSPIRTWDVHPDGDSFVFVTRPETGDVTTPIVPLELIVNFFELLRAREPD